MEQWESAPKKGAVTVTQALNLAKGALNGVNLTVVGEVSKVSVNPRYKAIYFTLADEGGAMDCMMWTSRYQACGVDLAVGMLVELAGSFDCYVKNGRMSFSATRLSLAGEGDLRVRVAALARKLELEGLMDPARKRPIPALPERIAVVTSPSGAAVHDVLRTLRRRFPLAEVQVCGVKVEGVGAEESICEGLACAANAQPQPQVILLVRGGGSYEALMPFNDERVARMVASCPVPVVCGIGHEPDNSICDMVADRRCSTPTAAAESVVPTRENLEQKMANARSLLAAAMEHRLEAASHRLSRLSERPVFTDDHFLTGATAQQLDLFEMRLSTALPNALASSEKRLMLAQEQLRLLAPQFGQQQQHELEKLEVRLRQAIPNALAADTQRLALLNQQMRALGAGLVSQNQQRLQLAGSRLRVLGPKNLQAAQSLLALRQQRMQAVGSKLLATQEQQTRLLAGRLRSLGPKLLAPYEKALATRVGKLDALSPLKVMARGYSITYGPRGVLTSVAGVESGEEIRVRMRDGALNCKVSSIEEE